MPVSNIVVVFFTKGFIYFVICVSVCVCMGVCVHTCMHISIHMCVWDIHLCMWWPEEACLVFFSIILHPFFFAIVACPEPGAYFYPIDWKPASPSHSSLSASALLRAGLQACAGWLGVGLWSLVLLSTEDCYYGTMVLCKDLSLVLD